MDALQARTRALELTLEHTPGGTQFDAIIRTAAKMATFIVQGKAPEEDVK